MKLILPFDKFICSIKPTNSNLVELICNISLILTLVSFVLLLILTRIINTVGKVSKIIFNLCSVNLLHLPHNHSFNSSSF